jgi:hypothetical protein
MFRRAVLGFLPAFLALAILCGTPATSVGSPEASATSWNAKSWGATRAPTPVVRGSLTQDVPDVSVNPSADEDDTPDDHIVRVVSAVVWPDPALDARLLRASDRAGRSHRACAAPPRAPPTA